MSTLIAVYNSSGCVGRCDAKCYDAQSLECDCICGGRNHGAGKDKAQENTHELAEDWLDHYHKEKGLDPSKTRSFIAESCSTIPLFDLSNFSSDLKKQTPGIQKANRCSDLQNTRG